jgi:hypothetical protein
MTDWNQPPPSGPPAPPPPNPHFQVNHRPLPQKGTAGTGPRAPRPLPGGVFTAVPAGGCLDCGTDLNTKVGGNAYGGPPLEDGIAVPTARQPVGGIGKPIPPNAPMPISAAEDIIARSMASEMEINPTVGTHLRETMMGGAPDWAQALWFEVKSTQVEIATIKTCLMMSRPLLDETLFSKVRALVEQDMDEQMRAMQAQLGQQFQPKPTQDVPVTNDPRASPRGK